MKVKVSDYIANFLAEKGIKQAFTVVGGGAMHLNDSIGHHQDIKSVYVHHEQAAAMAAEGYARVTNRPAIVCVTSGPGAINALNGVAGAYQDSIPMIVLSGQTKSSLMARNSGLKLRTLGNQEFDIVPALGDMTKYAVTVMEPEKIRYYLEKAYTIAVNGRPGPCWLDIPLDVQGAYVEYEELNSYTQEEQEILNGKLLQDTVEVAYEKLYQSKRPIIYAGNGIRLSGGVELLHELAETLQIPVVTCWDSIDLIETENPIYCGRGGTMGDRAGNFAVQNSDFLLCIGTRLNIYQVGYQKETWAREAYVVDVDIDSQELKKPTIHVELPVCADASVFMRAFLDYHKGRVADSENENIQSTRQKWLKQCGLWKKNYPVVQKKHYESEDGLVNVYAFIDRLSRKLENGSITVVTNGSASVVGSQGYFIKKNSRFIMNCAMSSMGYGLPASVGACVANDRKQVVCIEGDGSIMMNLQELQTVSTNKLPIKIFIINNNGYHQIRLTQTNLFNGNYIGIGPESGDLGFPNFEKIAAAFDLNYVAIHGNDGLEDGIDEALNNPSATICEVFVSTYQIFEPKSATKRLEDGTLFSPPLEDLAPFLSREELKSNMYISLIEEKH